MSITALFVTAEKQKPHKHLSHIRHFTHTMDCYPATIRNEVLQHGCLNPKSLVPVTKDHTLLDFT